MSTSLQALLDCVMPIGTVNPREANVWNLFGVVVSGRCTHFEALRISWLGGFYLRFHARRFQLKGAFRQRQRKQP
jgi:hypothetical protein